MCTLHNSPATHYKVQYMKYLWKETKEAYCFLSPVKFKTKKVKNSTLLSHYNSKCLILPLLSVTKAITNNSTYIHLYPVFVGVDDIFHNGSIPEAETE